MRNLGVSLGAAQQNLTPGRPLTHTDLSDCNPSSCVSRDWLSLLGEFSVPLSLCPLLPPISPSGSASPFPSGHPQALSCLDMSGVCVSATMPSSESVSSDSSSVPIPAPGVTVLLFQTPCKHVQIEVEPERQGEGLGLKECTDVALSFRRTAPSLTGGDLEGWKPWAQDNCLVVSLTVTGVCLQLSVCLSSEISFSKK